MGQLASWLRSGARHLVTLRAASGLSLSVCATGFAERRGPPVAGPSKVVVEKKLAIVKKVGDRHGHWRNLSRGAEPRACQCARSV
jgi:hypothetical protein